MHKELKEVDIQRMARSTWEDYFKTRFHPRVKTPYLIALVTFLVSLALIFAVAADAIGSTASTTGPGVTVIAVVLLLTAAALFLVGIFRTTGERDRYIEHAQSEWEVDEWLPDNEQVKTFVIRRSQVDQ